MDYGPATLEALPEIVDAVGGKIVVLVDGGFRRGSDIAKAIELGANAVLLGRAARWEDGFPSSRRRLRSLRPEYPWWLR